MRLTQHEIASIRNTFIEIFKNGEIYLFGSRTDNTKKGGDIDLYIKLGYPLSRQEALEKKSQFRVKLEEKIGEQKIDIIVSKDTKSPIEQEALQKGIKL